MKIHHIGILSDCILESANAYEVLGYKRGPIVDDKIQQCKICFLKGSYNEPMIEVIQPLETNVTMCRMLKKRGNSPYHICFEVDDIWSMYSKLTHLDGWIPVFSPIKAVACDNKLISYFMKGEVGLVEFIEK